MKNFKSMKNLAGAAIALGALGFATQASASGNAGKLVINEYNAVSEDKMLDDCKHSPAQGDQYFGCIDGNGGEWIEFVVTQNNLNIQGWTLEWENADSGDHANNGYFTFSDENEIWSGLKAGTIIAVHDGSGPIRVATGTNHYDPCAANANNSRWLISVDVNDDAYFLDAALYNDANYLGWGFKADNDDWRGRIIDDGGNPSTDLVQNWVGENEALWNGAGLSGEECGKLEANPVGTGGTGNTNYVDGDSCTFAGPNFWSGMGAPQSMDALCNAACGTQHGCCDDTTNTGAYFAGTGGGTAQSRAYDCYERIHNYYY